MSSTPIGLTALLIFLFLLLMTSLLVNVYLLYTHYYKRRKSTKSSISDQLCEFLRDQAEKSKKEKTEKNSAKIDKNIATLRYAYLSIEVNSLLLGVDSNDYWESLDRGLAKVFSRLILSRDSSSSFELTSSAEELKQVANEIDQAYASHIVRTKDQIDSSFQEIYNLINSKGLAKADIESLKNIENSVLKEIKSDSVFRLVVKKRLMSFALELEKYDAA